MRIVVFSDSHNNFYPLSGIVRKHGDTDLFIYLGDGERDVLGLIDAFPNIRFLYVSGNCDWGSLKSEQAMTVCAGRKILYTHGHTLLVKHGLGRLKRQAMLYEADIALFGHTHVAMTAYEDGLYLMNPGSIASPRNGAPSYGIVDITPAGVVLNIVHL